MREYAEDTVFRALVPTTTTFSARRRTMFLFHTNPEIPNPYLWVDNKPGIWDDLNNALDQIKPGKIAVNVSGPLPSVPLNSLWFSPLIQPRSTTIWRSRTVCTRARADCCSPSCRKSGEDESRPAAHWVSRPLRPESGVRSSLGCTA